uniref:Uncharacterized protein n=1 Tax=Rhizophora mucronata TaxID=61149 RepID=A0A2P2J0X1_RHIMU
MLGGGVPIWCVFYVVKNINSFNINFFFPFLS